MEKLRNRPPVRKIQFCYSFFLSYTVFSAVYPYFSIPIQNLFLRLEKSDKLQFVFFSLLYENIRALFFLFERESQPEGNCMQICAVAVLLERVAFLRGMKTGRVRFVEKSPPVSLNKTSSREEFSD